MGAYIDLDIFLKKGEFSLSALFSLLEKEQLSVQIEELIRFDDWPYENPMEIDLETLEREKSHIFVETFTTMYFKVNNTWGCVLITSFDEYCMRLSFGLDTNDLPQPVKDNDIVHLFDIAVTYLDDVFDDTDLRKRFLVATIGVETSVDFHNEGNEMMLNSSGVARLITPGVFESEASLEDDPCKEKKKNIVVYSNSSWCFF